MRTEFAPSCPVSIFIAGDYHEAAQICSDYCNSLVWFTLGTIAGGIWVAMILVAKGVVQ